jgi:glycosyltransferase involved in cell wall biosynthesis
MYTTSENVAYLNTVNKKVLIITYYWPPSGGGGVQRWLKFVKYLPEFGWEPIVFTPENPDFDLKDESLVKDISKELEVLKFPIWEPYQLFKKLSGKKELKQGQVLEEGDGSTLKQLAIWIRGNWFIPDPKKFWVKPSVEYLNSMLISNGINTVITTGPPHSMHLIGLKLKEKNPELNWIADFRDPWSQWDILDKFRLKNTTRKKHQKLESEVFKLASKVITVSETWKKEFEQIGAKKVEVITNGFDSSDIQPRPKALKDKFRITHAGMLNDFRNPAVLWQALKELVIENLDLKKDLEINLIGTLSNSINHELMGDADLKDSVVLVDHVPHDDIFNEYSKAAVLLLILNDSKNAKGHLPGKLFEYMAVGTSVLGIGEDNGDAAKVLFSTNSGRVIAPNDKEGMKMELLELYNNWKADIPLIQESIDKYERKNLTSELVNLLENL